MSQLVLNRGIASKAEALRKYVLNMKFGPYFLLGSLVFFVVLITIITLMFSTRQVTKGYVLSSLETAQHKLIKESEGKDMQISQVRSLSYIQDLDRVRIMVKPAQVSFVTGGGALVSK